MKTVMTMIAACLALVLLGNLAAAQAASTGGQCTGATATEFISADNTDNSQLTTWASVTGAHLNFTTGTTGCVIIMFNGVGLINSNILHVRTLLDGHLLCAPATSSDFFVAGEHAIGSYSIMRVCKNVAAGPHDVVVQYRADNTNQPVAIIGHQMTVTHN